MATARTIRGFYGGHWIQAESVLRGPKLDYSALGVNDDLSFPMIVMHFGFGVTGAGPVGQNTSALNVRIMREPLGGVFARPPG